MTPPFPHEKEKKLSEVCSFGIGGPAKFFSEAKTILEMQQMIAWAYGKMPFFILGKGSNCLFDDRGFNGLVIHSRIDTMEQQGDFFILGSGYSFARIGKQTARLGLHGLEFASGIPATVGGAIYMNAGACNQETQECLKSVLFVDERGELKNYKKEELEFGYRFSSFQKMKGAIVQGTFLLTPKADAKENQRKTLEKRLETQPYKDKSAGCVFRNPIGTSAGKLIDECGLKGIHSGGAAVSTLHANFLINAEKASAQDILNLIQLVKKRVYEEKGIMLEEEIRYIPYDI